MDGLETMRKKSGTSDIPMSNYKLHAGKKTSAKYAYDLGIKADMNSTYFMKSKKDTSSTSNEILNVIGKVTF